MIVTITVFVSGIAIGVAAMTAYVAYVIYKNKDVR